MTEDQKTPPPNLNPENTESYAKRLERLTKPVKIAQYNLRYSTFIRWARLVLPIIALGIATIVFTWNNLSDTNIVPVKGESRTPRSMGKNELLNPRFESSDEKQQPYTITAGRAIQGEKDEDLVILEDPVADILLNNGNWVAIKAEQGAFAQDDQKLLLRGKVNIYHDRGYQLEMEQLHVDINENTAWADVDVYGQGPAGTLNAKGLKGYTETGHLIFNGPAKLVLNRNVPGAGIGELLQ